jgi:hypothetical protein
VRNATVTIKASGDLEKTIFVTQAGAAATLAVFPASFSDVPASGNTLAITVVSNSEWRASSDLDWCTLSSMSGTTGGPINVTVARNAAPTPRNATITFTADGLTQKVTVTQLGILLPPSEPTNVVAEPLSATSMRVSWTAVPNATMGYKIYYTTPSIQEKTVAGSVNSATTTSYTHTGLTKKTAYAYYVTARNSAGESTYPPPARAEIDEGPGIILSVTESGHIFPPAYADYGAQDALPVIISNSGDMDTGPLTVELSGINAPSFTLTPSIPSPATPSLSIPSIAVGENYAFSVAPITGLMGTHSATITVSGSSDIVSKSFMVFFSVVVPTYSISLSETGTCTFPEATEGYTTQPSAKTVTITNTGNQATGDLTVALSGTDDNSFTLSATTISSIAAVIESGAGTATFRVQPIIGLLEKTHTATVTVSGDHDITQSFEVSFTVNSPSAPPPPPPPPPPTPAGTDISLSQTEPYVFASKLEGYEEAPDPLTVTITNEGDFATGELKLDLEGPWPFFLESQSGIVGPTIAVPSVAAPSIAVGETATFKVTPKVGLLKGIYKSKVVVSGDGIKTAQSFDVSFEVTREGTVAAPVISPAGGVINYDTEVSITCTTPEATIYYIFVDTWKWEGAPPINPDFKYTGPFTFGAQVQTIRAIATKPGMENSPVTEQTFTLVDAVAQPVADPSWGPIEPDQEITLTCATPGATIRYFATPDGRQLPTATTGTVYSGPFTPPSLPTTIAAIAIKDGMRTSQLMWASYIPIFKAVTNITNVPDSIFAGIEIDLNQATVEPEDADYRTIVWQIKPGPGAANFRNNKFTPTVEGDITFTATVANGLGEGIPYTQDFTIHCNAATLVNYLKWIRNNAQPNQHYLIPVSADEAVDPIILDDAGFNNQEGVTITIEGVNKERTITLREGQGSIFTIVSTKQPREGPLIHPTDEGSIILIHPAERNILILGNNITLKGDANNNVPLVVLKRGNFVMNSGSTITGNGAGAVKAEWEGTFAMYEGATIRNNKIGDVDGCAGVFMADNSVFYLDGGTISNNKSRNRNGIGGGVYLDRSKFYMPGGSITNNEGGGVYLANSVFFMLGGSITLNSTTQDQVALTTVGGAAGGGGGGVNAVNSASDMIGGTISRNYGYTFGGVRVFAGHFHISGNATISDNHSDGHAGGVAVSYGGEFFMHQGGSIKDNIAEDSGGGVAIGAASKFIMEDGEIATNVAKYGGGVSVDAQGGILKTGGTIYGSGHNLANRITRDCGRTLAIIDKDWGYVNVTIGPKHELRKTTDKWERYYPYFPWVLPINFIESHRPSHWMPEDICIWSADPSR